MNCTLDDSLKSGDDAAVECELELRVPYYLENFRWIVSQIQQDHQFQILFSEDGGLWQKTVASFKALREDSQKLYVRLFLRKHAYLTRNKVKYEDEFGVKENVDGLLSNLCSEGFIESTSGKLDLEERLTLLNSPQIKDLAKKFRIGKPSQGKADLVPLIVRTCRQQRTPFGPPLSVIVAGHAARILGPVYRLENGPRDVFMHILSLFQLTAGFSSVMGQNPIFGLLQLNLGRLSFPPFTVHSERPLFQSLKEMTEFDQARQSLDEMYVACESRTYERGKSLYRKALPLWEGIVDNVELTGKIADLPPYTRKFTAGYYWTKVIEMGLECLERLNEKSDAINGYLQLLGQTVYVPHHRGAWYNRATILMLKIDKNPDAVVKKLVKGLKDDCLRPYQKVELLERLKRVYKPDQLKKKHKFSLEDLEIPYKHGPKVEICGKLCPTERMGKGKTVFLGEDDGMFAGSVEELALAHYRKAGYTEGLHSEGGIFSTIYGLLFWDVIYCEGVAEVFRSAFQIAPLDFTCSSFFFSRKVGIDDRLTRMKESPIEKIVADVSETWNSHHGIQSAAVNWDIFASLEVLLCLLHCFRPDQLARICKRYAQDYAAVRSGFPDLTVWNAVEKKLKVAEVKSPNDRLSYKQILWIDFLMEIEVPVEVCHVVASGSKRKFSVMNV